MGLKRVFVRLCYPAAINSSGFFVEKFYGGRDLEENSFRVDGYTVEGGALCGKWKVYPADLSNLHGEEINVSEVAVALSSKQKYASARQKSKHYGTIQANRIIETTPDMVCGVVSVSFSMSGMQKAGIWIVPTKRWSHSKAQPV